MKLSKELLFAACLTMIVAATWPKATTAAEGETQAQDLAQVKAADQVMAARWARRPDAYVLQVVVAPSQVTTARAQATADPTAPVAAQERPQPFGMLPPPTISIAGAGPGQDRGSFFIGNTIASLRGLDPTFCGRVLTLVRDARSAGGQPTPTPPIPLSVNQPYPPRIRDGRVEVWLLKADGTQILPATYSCDKGPRAAPTESPPVEITYEFPLASGEQAVAAAIRIGENYYIEKLQPLTPKPAAL